MEIIIVKNNTYKTKTIFCDIDGTLIKHHGSLSKQLTHKPEILEGVIEKFDEWDRKCYNIILTTGRKESLRRITENQLAELGLVYDQLIMGIGGGPRILINDIKPSGLKTAFSVNLERNKGIRDVQL